MPLSDVQHQDRAVAVLRRALRSGRMHHAYLFDGPEGVGKELTARALAARLLCLDTSLAADADACGQCTSCRLLARDSHPDLHVIDRALHKLHPDRTIRSSKGLFLVVDVIRHFLIEPAGMMPTQSPHRVFLIRDAERMNEEAQNALLKTLEEPPGSACLILVTASASRLLPTIRSRCQRIPFDLLPSDFVAAELAARTKLSSADAKTLAGLAGGRLGVALAWHKMDLLPDLDSVGQCLDALPAGDVETFAKTLVELATGLAERARTAGTAADEGDSEEMAESGKSGGKVATNELRDALKLTFLLVSALYREALLRHSNAAELCTLSGQESRVEQLAARRSFDELDAGLHAIGDAERMLDRNVAPQLTCEHLAVALLGGVTAGR